MALQAEIYIQKFTQMRIYIHKIQQSIIAQKQTALLDNIQSLEHYLNTELLKQI